jgi:hypothetical protein
MDVTGWAPIVAQQRYGIEQIAANVHPIRTITLTNSVNTVRTGTHPGTGAIRNRQFPSGNRYLLDTSEAGGNHHPASGAAASVTAAVPQRVRVERLDDRHRLQRPARRFAIRARDRPASPASPQPTRRPTYSPVAQAGAGLGTVTPAAPRPLAAQRWRCASTCPAHVGDEHRGRVVDQRRLLGVGRSISGSSATNLGGHGNHGHARRQRRQPGLRRRRRLLLHRARQRHHRRLARDVETPQQLGTRCRRGCGLQLAFAQATAAGNCDLPRRPRSSAYQLPSRCTANSTQVYGPHSRQTDAVTVNNKVNILIAASGRRTAVGRRSSRTCRPSSTAYSMLTDLPERRRRSTARTITLGRASRSR